MINWPNNQWRRYDTYLFARPEWFIRFKIKFESFRAVGYEMMTFRKLRPPINDMHIKIRNRGGDIVIELILLGTSSTELYLYKPVADVTALVEIKSTFHNGDWVILMKVDDVIVNTYAYGTPFSTNHLGFWFNTGENVFFSELEYSFQQPSGKSHNHKIHRLRTKLLSFPDKRLLFLRVKRLRYF